MVSALPPGDCFMCRLGKVIVCELFLSRQFSDTSYAQKACDLAYIYLFFKLLSVIEFSACGIFFWYFTFAVLEHMLAELPLYYNINQIWFKKIYFFTFIENKYKKYCFKCFI